MQEKEREKIKGKENEGDSVYVRERFVLRK